MQHRPINELARDAIRAKICPRCYQRPAGSESLGPKMPRACEPQCTVFLSLPRLLPAEPESLQLHPDGVMRKLVCQSCHSSASAGDYCADSLSRTCPLSRYAGELLQILEQLKSNAHDC